MKRILLAFLALLGIVAQAAPVSARVCGVGAAEVGSVGVPQAQYGAFAAVTESAQQQMVRREAPLPVLPMHAAARKKPVFIPSVQLGPDRALE